MEKNIDEKVSRELSEKVTEQIVSQIKTRVPKGEKFWYVHLGLEGISVLSAIDFGDEVSDFYFRQGNYFHTQEEAESMARKLRAVLKGAEVIESSQAVLAFNDFLAKLKEDRVIDYDEGVKYMKEFQSKIIK